MDDEVQTTTGAEAAASPPVITAALVRSDHAAVAEALQREGASQERERIAAILDHAEADGREAMARHLAFETDTTAEAAGQLLAVAPKESTPEPPGGLLGDAMAGVDNPAVGVVAAGDDDASAVKGILDTARAAGSIQ